MNISPPIRQFLIIAAVCVASLLLSSQRASSAGNSFPWTADNFPLTWQLAPELVVEKDHTMPLAPDVRVMDDGTYRMFYTMTGEGVGSSSSADGIAWTRDEKLRITSLRWTDDYREGEMGFDLGHPWLMPLNGGGWRMYMQANSGLHTPLQILSATSENGFDFEMEPGVRVSIGPRSGPPALSFAGHGRAWRQDDDTLLMVFSGNLLNDKNPSDIMLAKSSDGLNWEVIDTCIYNNGHDPAIIQLDDGSVAMVFTYLKESLRVGFSEDGINWTEAEKLRLIDSSGEPMENIMGDVAVTKIKNGELRIFTNAFGGIGVFEPEY